MKINKYWKPKPLKKYIRKNKCNKTYKKSLTIRRKNINENRAIALLLVSFLFGTTYAFAMTSNEIHINGGIVSDTGTVKQVEPILEGGATIQSPPTGMVENEIRNIAKEYNFQWADYLVRLAKCENRTLNPKVINDKGNTPSHSIDRGIFQINNYWHSEVSNDCAFDVRCSTEFTIRMINAGRQGEWVCDSLI